MSLLPSSLKVVNLSSTEAALLPTTTGSITGAHAHFHSTMFLPLPLLGSCPLLAVRPPPSGLHLTTPPNSSLSTTATMVPPSDDATECQHGCRPTQNVCTYPQHSSPKNSMQKMGPGSSNLPRPPTSDGVLTPSLVPPALAIYANFAP
jgi:hypothetical protein